MGEGPGFGEVSVSRQAVRAQMIASKITGKAEAAAGTARVGYLGELADTGGADPRRILRFPLFPAEGTSGREEKIEQGLPPRGHLQVLRG